MDTFFTYLKKILIGFVGLSFAVAVVYTPQNFTKEAEAGAAYGGSNVVGQGVQVVKNIASVGLAVLSTIAEKSIVLKEFVLDGLGLIIFKRIAIAMTDGLVEWMYNGFNGRPRFLDNLSSFLGEQAMAAVDLYVEANLGPGLSFICDPFKLDIGLTIDIADYQGGQPNATCSVTDIFTNFEDFTTGGVDSFSNGGWKDWLTVTSDPDSFTAMGAVGVSESAVLSRIASVKAEETSLLSFASGFFSQKQCSEAEGESTETKCDIGTPGSIVQQAFSNSLDTNRQMMVEADEFDELLAGFIGVMANAGTNALFNQFVNATVNKNGQSAVSSGDVSGINSARTSGLSDARSDAESELEQAEAEGEAIEAESEAEREGERAQAQEDWEREREQLKEEIREEVREDIQPDIEEDVNSEVGETLPPAVNSAVNAEVAASLRELQAAIDALSEGAELE